MDVPTVLMATSVERTVEAEAAVAETLHDPKGTTMATAPPLPDVRLKLLEARTVPTMVSSFLQLPNREPPEPAVVKVESVKYAVCRPLRVHPPPEVCIAKPPPSPLTVLLLVVMRTFPVTRTPSRQSMKLEPPLPVLVEV